MESAKYAVDLLKTLITISSGAFILTCNLLLNESNNCPIKISIICFFFSISLGLFSIGKVTGLIDQHESPNKPKNLGDSIIQDRGLKTMTRATFIFFIIGCSSLLWFALTK